MKEFSLDHVERLSRGKKSGRNIGSRAVGHYLRPHERATYRRALNKGYLDITHLDRPNLWHLWEKACLAQDQVFWVLHKNLPQDVGTIYRNNTLFLTDTVANAKDAIQRELEKLN